MGCPVEQPSPEVSSQPPFVSDLHCGDGSCVHVAALPGYPSGAKNELDSSNGYSEHPSSVSSSSSSSDAWRKEDIGSYRRSGLARIFGLAFVPVELLWPGIKVPPLHSHLYLLLIIRSHPGLLPPYVCI
jgi:hypothetical protein